MSVRLSSDSAAPARPPVDSHQEEYSAQNGGHEGDDGPHLPTHTQDGTARAERENRQGSEQEEANGQTDSPVDRPERHDVAIGARVVNLSFAVTGLALGAVLFAVLLFDLPTFLGLVVLGSGYGVTASWLLSTGLLYRWSGGTLYSKTGGA